MQQQVGFSDERTRKISVTEFLRMVDAGILHEDDRVELLDGKLFVMTPTGTEHASTAERLYESLRASYGRDFRVWNQSSWLASRLSLPQPDAAVMRGRPHAFDHRFPTGKDTVLLVEVSWSSRSHDRAKAAIYARAGVPTYWRLDVEQRILEVYTRPGRRGYRTMTAYAETRRVRLPSTRKSLKIADLLPLP